MKDFIELVKTLREKCPWDREQTLKSLVPQLIEEIYELDTEVIENNTDNIVEEFGDVFLTVFMMGVILEEKGISFDDVIDKVSKKMIARHPHVFGEEKASSAEEVLEKWDKRKGKKWKIGRGLPALLRSSKIQKKASRKGFDWDEIEGVFEKINEELEELKNSRNEEEKTEELGDILFAVAHLGNFLNINPEMALQKANDKFEKRFDKLEKTLLDKKISDFSIEELESMWQKVKEKNI
ncbi:MAG: nucleoside triphosphate pyrophosphohydrolase [candidate division WOR-3 bacterium]